MQLLYIDLFCGAGGTTTGIESAKINGERCAKVIACVNHDKNAIISHQANHPDTMHFTEDIRTLNLTNLVRHKQNMCAKYSGAYVVLWASLECTNFSKAKGGQARDPDSRTLANHLFRYIEHLNPDYIQIENVEEFMSWGDLDENGKPVSKDAGRLYAEWVSKVCRYGYDFDYRILNSADYGAYTTRKRFFGIFARHGLPIVFPAPTHSKNGSTNLFGGLKKWNPVRDVLDLNDEGESIFKRKRPLVEKTLQRIYAGLIKFVAGGKEAFLLKYNSMNQSGHYIAPSLDEPCPTVTCQKRLGLVKAQFLSKQFSGHPESKNIPLDAPAGTITCIDHHAFVTVLHDNGYKSTTKFSSIETEVSDSPMTIKIKAFMALYGISDIRMRMLRIPELKRIMGFSSDYVLVGKQAEQTKFIGNAVEVHQSRALCEALCQSVTNKTKQERI